MGWDWQDTLSLYQLLIIQFLKFSRLSSKYNTFRKSTCFSCQRTTYSWLVSIPGPLPSQQSNWLLIALSNEALQLPPGPMQNLGLPCNLRQGIPSSVEVTTGICQPTGCFSTSSKGKRVPPVLQWGDKSCFSSHASPKITESKGDTEHGLEVMTQTACAWH